MAIDDFEPNVDLPPIRHSIEDDRPLVSGSPEDSMQILSDWFGGPPHADDLDAYPTGPVESADLPPPDDWHGAPTDAIESQDLPPPYQDVPSPRSRPQMPRPARMPGSLGARPNSSYDWRQAATKNGSHARKRKPKKHDLGSVRRRKSKQRSDRPSRS